MKKMKSLVAAFTLAAAGIVTMGASTAQAQTVPVYPQGQVYSQPVQLRTAVTQGAIDDLAYNVGVQTAYHRAGVGFTQGTASDGENVGLEFQLNNNNATVTRAFNLDDPNSRIQFQQQVDNAYAREQYLAGLEYGSQRPVYYTYYEPATYVICPPVVPIIGIGWIIGGWHPGYVPTYHRWNGFWDDHGHRNHRWDGGHNNTTIIHNNTTIINRNNPWIGGGQRHDNHNGGQWRGNGGGDHNRTIINNPPPVVRTPPVRHAEPRQAEPRRVEQPAQPRQRVAEVQQPQRGQHQGGQQGGQRQGGERQGGQAQGRHDGGQRGPGGHHR
ncbi:MAG: hypothetical protein ACAH83_02685 [Alphaproteobacteria bacterium]